MAAGSEQLPPPWIAKGVVVNVRDALNGKLHVATIKSDPYIKDDVYMVKIKWFSCHTETVECSRCISPLAADDSSNEPHRTRHRSKRRPPVIVTTSGTDGTATGTLTSSSTTTSEDTDDTLLPMQEVEMPESLSTTTLDGMDVDNGSIGDALSDQGDNNEEQEQSENSTHTEQMPAVGDSNEVGVDESQGDEEELLDSNKSSFSWIHERTMMRVLGGNKEYYFAEALSEPYHNGESLVVNIKWKDALYKQFVDCRVCLPVDFSTDKDEPRFKRRRHAVTKKGQAIDTKEIVPQDEHAKSTKVKKRDGPSFTRRKLNQESNMHGEGRAFLNEDNEAVLSDFSERELVKRSLLAGLPGSYSPEQIDSALDAVGAPFGQNEIMAYLRSIVPKTTTVWWKEPKHFRVEIGMAIRRIHQDNKKPVFGTVVEKVQEKVENNELELVQVWKVVYPDGDCEELEEKQLRRYRYPAPIRPPCLGRDLHCLELFGGTSACGFFLSVFYCLKLKLTLCPIWIVLQGRVWCQNSFGNTNGRSNRLTAIRIQTQPTL